MPDNIFEKVKVTETAPTSVGANSVNEPIKLYQPDAKSMKKDVLSNINLNQNLKNLELRISLHGNKQVIL